MRAWGWERAVVLAVVVAAACDGGAEDNAATTTGAGTDHTSGPPMAMTLGTLPTSAATTSTADASTSGEGASSSGVGASTEATDGSSTAGPASSTGASTTSGDTAGLGELSGPCGVLTERDIQSAQPQFIANAIDFGDTGFDYDLLTPGAQEVHDEGNLGGSSLFSEVMSFDVLARCEGVSLLKTESEIVYDDESGPKTDLLVEYSGVQVGVSVTRAVAFPFDDPYPSEAATTLLEDKLAGVVASSANVSAGDAWAKQILHILAYAPMHADVLEAAYAEIDASLKGDTIVWVTVSNGDDLFIYD